MPQQITVITPKEHARLIMTEVKYNSLLRAIESCSSKSYDGRVSIDGYDLSKLLEAIEPDLYQKVLSKVLSEVSENE